MSTGSIRTSLMPVDALETSPEFRADTAGQIRERLRPRDFGFLSSHLVDGPPGHDQCHDVGFRERWLGGPARLGLPGRSRHRNSNVVIACLRVQHEVDGRDDAPVVEEGDEAALDFIAARIERDLAAFDATVRRPVSPGA